MMAYKKKKEKAAKAKVMAAYKAKKDKNAKAKVMAAYKSKKAIAKDAPAVAKQLERARKKFDQMDDDKNGVLNGGELDKLASWVFESFHPGGEPIDESTKKEQAAALLKVLDENADGVLEFEEFSTWFTTTC